MRDYGSRRTIELTLEGFKAECIIDVNNCWIWQRACANGYPVVRIGDRASGKLRKVRHVIYELETGKPYPTGLVQRHQCNSTKCINPEHTPIGTRSEDRTDLCLSGSHRPRGRKMLSAEQVNHIRTSPKTGAQLARELHETQTTISEIRTGKTYTFYPKD